MNRINFTIFVALFIASCGAKQNTDGVYKGDKCTEIPQVSWSHVESGYDKKTVIDLAAKIQAAIEVDAKTIKDLGNGNASTNLNLQVNKVLSSKEYKTADVSKEIYNQGIAFRTVVCNLWQLIKVGDLTPTQKEKVINEMLLFSKTFSDIQAKEKKNQQ